MADYTLSAKITGDPSSFEKAISRAENSLSNFGSLTSKLGDRLTNTITKPALAAGTALAGITLVKGWNRLTALDSARAKLAAIGNTAEDVEQIMSDALASVKGTAFGMDEAATTAASAVAAGIKPGKKLQKYLTAVADAAAVAGTDMESMGAIFNKVATQGKANNEVLHQLAEKGIPIYQYLADETGKTAEQIFELAKDGQINLETFQKAVETHISGAAVAMGDATLKGSIDNLMASISRIGANFLGSSDDASTFGGQIRDIIINLRKNVLEPLEQKAKILGQTFGDAFSRVVEKTKSFIESFKKINEATNGVLGKFTKFGSVASVALGPAIKTLGKIITALEKLIPGFNKLLGPIAAVSAAIALMWKSSKIFRESIIKVGKEVIGVFKELFSAIVPIVKGISRAIKDIAPIAGDVIGMILKSLKPFLKLVQKLAPAIVAVGTAIAGWKIGKKVQSLVNVFQKAQVSLKLFKAQSTSTTIAQAALNGVLTKSEIITALFTKQLTLSQIATALSTKATQLFNTTLRANPIGMVVTALGLLVGGLAIVKLAMSESDSETAKFQENLKRLNEDIADYKERMGELAETRDKTIEQGVSEVNYYKTLKEELDGLVDVNGQVKKGYEDRAAFIVSTLNDALGTEIKMTDGVIANYGEISNSIDKVIEKKKAEIILNAYEEEYAEAIKERGKLLDGLATKEEAVARAQEDYHKAAARGGAHQAERLVTLENKLQRAKDDYNDYTKLVKDNSLKISNYEKMAADMTANNYDKVIMATGELGTAYTDLTSLTMKETQDQLKVTQERLSALRNYYKETGDQAVKSDIERYEKQKTELEKHLNGMQKSIRKVNWDASGGYIIDGILVGISTREYKLMTKMRNVADSISKGFNKALAIKSPSRVMAESGKFIMMGIAKGIKKAMSKTISMMDKASAAIIDKSPTSEMTSIKQSIPQDFSVRYANETAFQNTVSETIDIERALQGMIINVYSQTNVDGTPLMEKAADYTVRKISSDQRNFTRMRGAFI